MPDLLPMEELRRRYLSGREPLAYLPYANALLNDRQFTQALDICLRGLEQRPSMGGRRLLAQIYLGMGRYPDAIQVLQDMINEGSEAFGAQFLLAKTYARCGRWKDAEELLRRLTEQNPSDAEVVRLLQKVQSELEMSEQLTPIEIESSPEPVDAQEQLRRHFSAQDGVGFCFLAQPSEGNVLENHSIEQLIPIILDKSEKIVKALELGTFQELMMEYDRGYVIARRTGQEFLIARFHRTIPPGQMRQMMGRYLERKS